MPRPNRGPFLKFLRGRGSYYVCWYEGGSLRKRSAGTADSGEAEAFLADFLRQRQLRARTGPRDPSQFPIAEALDLYGELHAPTTAAPDRIGYALAALLPFWGESMVGDISDETCQAYCEHRAKSDGTVRRELGTLRAAVNFAHKKGRIIHAPAVWLPEKPEGRERFLTRAEAAALLNAARTGRSDTRLYLPLFIVLALYTGARKEAILSLRWPQVDLERRRINFRRPGERKTAKGRAHIPIPDRLLTFLRLARRRGSDLGPVVHLGGNPIKDIGGAWDGNPERSGDGSFGRTCKRAGLAHVTPHTLRHTCGTWLAQGGVDLWEIAGWLGHSHEHTVTLYAHHHPDFLDNARRTADRRA